MKNICRVSFRLAGGLLLAISFSHSAKAQCPSNGLAVVVNKANPIEGLSMAQLRRLLLGDMRNWPDKRKVALIAPDPRGPAFKCMLSSIVRMTEVEYRRFIASVQFRGDEPIELHLASSGAMAGQMIAGSAGGIAFVEESALPGISASVRVLRINGKQPGEAGYPL